MEVEMRRIDFRDYSGAGSGRGTTEGDCTTGGYAGYREGTRQDLAHWGFRDGPYDGKMRDAGTWYGAAKLNGRGTG